LISFDVGIFCTLGVSVFPIGLSIVAVWIGVTVLVLGIGSFTLALGATYFGSVSPCGGFAVRSNVTRLVSGGGLSISIGADSGVVENVFKYFECLELF
jgi:hypothetical protein